MERSNLLFVLAWMMALFVSCSNRTAAPEASLNGNWELRSAMVNGKTTERMSDLYFTFSEDGTLYTNILGTPQVFRYTLEEDRIIQGGETPIEYIIHQLLDTSLILSTDINGSNFEFVLVPSGGD